MMGLMTALVDSAHSLSSLYDYKGLAGRTDSSSTVFIRDATIAHSGQRPAGRGMNPLASGISTRTTLDLDYVNDTYDRSSPS